MQHEYHLSCLQKSSVTGASQEGPIECKQQVLTCAHDGGISMEGHVDNKHCPFVQLTANTRPKAIFDDIVRAIMSGGEGDLQEGFSLCGVLLCQNECAVLPGLICG